MTTVKKRTRNFLADMIFIAFLGTSPLAGMGCYRPDRFTRLSFVSAGSALLTASQRTVCAGAGNGRSGCVTTAARGSGRPGASGGWQRICPSSGPHYGTASTNLDQMSASRNLIRAG